MAYNPKVPVAVMDAMLNQIGSNASGGKLRIYDGTQPTNGGDPLSGNNLLAEMTMGSPAFSSASSGTLTANAIPFNVAAMSGTPTWFRLVESDGATVLCDGSAGVGSS